MCTSHQRWYFPEADKAVAKADIATAMVFCPFKIFFLLFLFLSFLSLVQKQPMPD